MMAVDWKQGVLAVLGVSVLAGCLVPMTDLAMAAPGKKPKQAVPVESTKPKRGAISRQAALDRIDRLIAEVQTRMDALSQVYDKQDKATLRQGFDLHQVPQRAYQYVDAWGPNGVYIVWANDTRPYYTRHLEALKESRNSIGRTTLKWIPEAEIEYLESGVAAWKTQEPQADVVMKQLVDAMSERAVYLGKAMDVRANPLFYTNPLVRQQLEPEAMRYDEQAKQWEGKVGEASKMARAYGQQEVFSALTVDPLKRIQPLMGAPFVDR